MFPFLAALLPSLMSMISSPIGGALLGGIGSYALDPEHDPKKALMGAALGGLGGSVMGGLGKGAGAASNIATNSLTKGLGVKGLGQIAGQFGATNGHVLPGLAAQASGNAGSGIMGLLKNPLAMGGAAMLLPSLMGGAKGVDAKPEEKYELGESSKPKPRYLSPLGGPSGDYGERGGEHMFFNDTAPPVAQQTDWLDRYPELRDQLKTGGIQGMKGGGLVRGPGTSTSDSVPAMTNKGKPIMLSDGEFVLNAKAVKKIGIENLHKINA